MKSIRLTIEEDRILNVIESTPGAELRPYRNPSKAFMYRLINDKYSPIQNISARYIEILHDKNKLIKKGGCYYPTTKNSK